MLTDYIAKKLKAAKYKILEDGSYFGEIPGLRGVWAEARTLEACRSELKEVLEGWLLLNVRNRKAVPGLPLKFERRAFAR